MDQEHPYHTTIDAVPQLGDFLPIVGRVYDQAFRRDFRAPGFALLRLPSGVGSAPLRRFMVSLKEALAAAYRNDSGRDLVYLSLARFDQQETTKFHVDGAPDESYLMLGYEPSEVASVVSIADFTRAAHDLGVEPKRYLADFNPMYVQGERRLAPYITRLVEFDPAYPQVLLINNSRLPFREDRSNTLGVMHQATVPNPEASRSRVVNSTMIVTAAAAEESPHSGVAQQVFLETTAVAGKIYG